MMSYARHRADSQYAPYTPHFQPHYRYPIALPHRPRAGDSYWPGNLPPAVHPAAAAAPAAHRSSKEVRFSLPTRSRTMPAHAANMAQPSTSRRAGVVALAPLLAHSPHGAPPLHYNLAHASVYARLPAASAPLSTAHRALPATSAPVDVMCLRSDALPWTIHISEAVPDQGVRVGDVLDGLSRALWRPLRADEFAGLDARTRERLEAAYRARVVHAAPTNARAVQAGGILRLDWLQGRALFGGLTPTPEPTTWALVLS